MHGSEKGLEKLKDVIDSLMNKNNHDHIHLMTKSWGGDELSDDKQCSENGLINHVKICKWS
ncbi:MAG: Imm32 family immunity protein [Simkaniaceae bacterium]|nr:Imm32 family immunity protein [Simkaniaceae bacterium]